MILYGFLAFVTVSTLIAFANWRAGLFLWLLIAILQDPVRKAIPGYPVYLTVSFAPVYAATFFAIQREIDLFVVIRRYFPSLLIRFQALIVCVTISALVGLITLGFSPIRTGIGVLSYFGGVPAVMIGLGLGIRQRGIIVERLIMAFIALTAILLIGVQLERWEVSLPLPVLGSMNAEKTLDLRWFNDYDYIAMTSGFYRSAEIMGWHAMVMVLCCLFMGFKDLRSAPIFGAIAIWGTYCALLSGRRKMLMLLVVFAAIMLVMSAAKDRQRILTYIGAVAIAMLFSLPFVTDSLYLMTFTSGLDTAAAKISEKGMQGPTWLFWIVGPFGYGVGAIAQGAQHFGDLTVEIPFVEGGFEKVMVELGLFGTAVGLLVAFEMLSKAYSIASWMKRSQKFSLDATFCFAFVIANLTAFLIAFQFLGDPFIASFVGLIYGVLLSFAVPEAKKSPRTPDLLRGPIDNRAPRNVYVSQIRG